MFEKIIFLDFDGPLSNSRVTLAFGDDGYMDPVALRSFNHVCTVAGAKIVCISIRALEENFQNRKENMWRFEQAGLDVSHIHPDWSCRDNRGSRKVAIEDWLARHPEVTDYVIVDDETVDLPNLIKVDMYNGMRMEDFRRIAEIFGVDLVHAFNEARGADFRPAQFGLPFEHYTRESNARLALKPISEEEKANGWWYEFPAEVWRGSLEDGRFTFEISMNGSGSRGRLSVSFENVRKGEEDKIYLKHLTGAVITPQAETQGHSLDSHIFVENDRPELG